MKTTCRQVSNASSSSVKSSNVINLIRSQFIQACTFIDVWLVTERVHHFFDHFDDPLLGACRHSWSTGVRGVPMQELEKEQEGVKKEGGIMGVSMKRHQNKIQD